MTEIISNNLGESPVKDRLKLKIAALFLITFLTVFVLLLGYDLFTGAVEARRLESNLPAQAVVTDIDPKIEKDLSKVIVFEEDAEKDLAVIDPFVDRGGISGLANTARTFSTGATLTSGENPATNIPGGPQNPAGRTSVTESSGNSRSTNGTGSTNSNSGVKTIVVLNTQDRIGIWKDKNGYEAIGDPPPSLFAIIDLIPIGVVDGGNRQKEVIFFSISQDRTFSLPIGTRFYDGWLMDVTDRGVIFASNADSRRTVEKSWGRGVRTRDSRIVSSNTTFGPPSNGQTETGNRPSDSSLGGSN